MDSHPDNGSKGKKQLPVDNGSGVASVSGTDGDGDSNKGGNKKPGFFKRNLNNLRNQRPFRNVDKPLEGEKAVINPAKMKRVAFAKRSYSQSDLGAKANVEETEVQPELSKEFPERMTPRRWTSMPKRLSISHEVDEPDGSTGELSVTSYSHLPIKQTAVESVAQQSSVSLQSEEITSTKLTFSPEKSSVSSVPVLQSRQDRLITAGKDGAALPSSSFSTPKKRQSESPHTVTPTSKSIAPVAPRSSATKFNSWVKSVTIYLFEGKDLPAMDRNGLSDPFCKFRLGAEKYRSKTAYKTLNPSWMEQFDLFIYDEADKELEISVWDWDRGVRNDYMGKAVVHLSGLGEEKLHDLWLDIINDVDLPCGSLHMSIMISGQKLSSEMSTVDSPATRGEIGDPVQRYNLRNSLNHTKDVGTVIVKVFRGCGLRAADLNGKSDPYCILQLVNVRMQTQVEPRTLDPEWNRVFTFPVNDLHAVLEIIVLDMDQDKKSDFLGRVSIPLLRIHNHERRWYALKDQKLIGRTKGSVLLEMELIYNPIRAALQTLKPREKRRNVAPPKFRRQLFVRNMTRVRNIFSPLLEYAHFIRSCFNWDDWRRSATALIVYLFVVYFFELWMIPAFILVFFVKHLIRQQVVQSQNVYAREPRDDEVAEFVEGDSPMMDEDQDWDQEDPNRLLATKSPSDNNTNSTSIVEKVRFAQEQLRTVQNTLEDVADLCERAQCTLHFDCPWLSTFTMLLLTGAMILLYFIPLRLILFVWGINKFTKKIRKPDSLGNNELLDLLSCAQTVEETRAYRELRPKDVPIPAAMAIRDSSPDNQAVSRRISNKPSVGK